MRFKAAIWAFVALMLASGAAARGAEGQDQGSRLVVDTFSGKTTEEGLPEGWKPFELPMVDKHTAYSVDSTGGDFHLKSHAEGSASALYKDMTFDVTEYQYLTWRWRVDGTLEKGDARTKAGDDYPARIYIPFEHEPEKDTWLDKLKYAAARLIYGVAPPGNTLAYIWANRLPRGEMVPNPYTGKVMMIAVESGDVLSGEWVTERRNVYEDYKRAFADEPPKAKAVVIMTDTDNTGESATAWFDDIVFEKME